MAKVKSVHNDVLDAALNFLKTYATQISICTGAGDVAPANYTEAVTTNMLAIKSNVAGTDLIVADDAASPYGRKLTVAQFAAIEVLTTGTAEYVCLCGAAANLWYVTTCTSQVLTDGNTVTIPSWKITIGDPT